MLVSKSWCEETAKDIMWEFEKLLSDKDMKISNENDADNEFENENSTININDYNELKEKIVKQLQELVDYAEYRFEQVA